ncbi:unnamed protein product [Prorocentrum cordatum]|uniref:Uncharacterized protein n=1 Tax=Prorocentrum cordatum TaxID=2364126 RepID=A0ABN9XLA1_9DINO|nr:unnamed protein product [Polarella glacialis]
MALTALEGRLQGERVGHAGRVKPRKTPARPLFTAGVPKAASASFERSSAYHCHFMTEGGPLVSTASSRLILCRARAAAEARQRSRAPPRPALPREHSRREAGAVHGPPSRPLEASVASAMEMEKMETGLPRAFSRRATSAAAVVIRLAIVVHDRGQDAGGSVAPCSRLAADDAVAAMRPSPTERGSPDGPQEAPRGCAASALCAAPPAAPSLAPVGEGGDVAEEDGEQDANDEEDEGLEPLRFGPSAHVQRQGGAGGHGRCCRAVRPVAGGEHPITRTPWSPKFDRHFRALNAVYAKLKSFGPGGRSRSGSSLGSSTQSYGLGLQSVGFTNWGARSAVAMRFRSRSSLLAQQELDPQSLEEAVQGWLVGSRYKLLRDVKLLDEDYKSLIRQNACVDEFAAGAPFPR